eukprot:CFRG8560T1
MSANCSTASLSPFEIETMTRGFQDSQAIYVIAKLEVPDILLDGPRQVDFIARKCGANTDFLYRLLRYLAAIDIFVESENKTFDNNTRSLPFCSRSSYRSICLMRMELNYEAFGKLLESLKQGTNCFQLCYGMGMFDYLKDKDEQRAVFTDAMEELALKYRQKVVAAIDLSKLNQTVDSSATLVDVGGANGALTCNIVRKFPNWKGIVFDRPEVVPTAIAYASTMGLSNRVTTHGGDFFENVPTGDIHFMSYILNDWCNDDCVIILKNIHNAMADGAVLMMIEMVIKEGFGYQESKMRDLIMMATSKGKERTTSEFKKLFASTGFVLTDVVDVPPTEHSILYARKA